METTENTPAGSHGTWRNCALMVCDAHGRHLPASVDTILDAARQIVDQRMRRGADLTSPSVVNEYLRTKLAGLEYEVFAVLFLDINGRLIEYVEMFRGTINHTSVHPREVVKAALRYNAAAVIVSHNHPSGCADATRADERMTEILKDVLALVDVRLLDHIIVAGDTTKSLNECGLL